MEEGPDKEVLESQYPPVSSESASESEAESSSGSELPPDKRPRVRALVVPEPQANWRVHLKSCVLHMPYGAKLFQCGKAIAANFRPAKDEDLDGKICSSCKRRM